jgi:Protein of unknown function (DUF1189)
VRRYSIFQAIPFSFFSRDLYREVVQSWRGIGLAYLVLLVTLLTLVVAIRVQIWSGGLAHGEGRAFADQIPRIVIRHRVVEVDRPMPYVIRDPKTGAELVVIDTTGQVVSLDSLQARVLITADHIVYRRSVAETRVFELSAVKDFTLDSTRANHWLRVLSTWAAPVVAPFVFVGSAMVRVIQQLVFAALGLLVGRLARVRFDFSASMRLAAVAMTPALVIEPALEVLKIRPPAWGWLCIAITLAYIVWAVRSSGPDQVSAASDPVEPQAPA